MRAWLRCLLKVCLESRLVVHGKELLTRRAALYDHHGAVSLTGLFGPMRMHSNDDVYMLT